MNVDYFIDGLAAKDPDVLDKLYAIFGNMKNFILVKIIIVLGF